MQIGARVENRRDRHQVTLTTNGQSHALSIPPRATGFGSSANGGELLALALATCWCNDLYREAAARGITVHGVEVQVDAEFGGPGDPARRIRYRAQVHADAPADAVRALVEHTDRVAEVHNTLRGGIAVELETGDPANAAP
jgi:organic hydroperoxide reductase OsmC/OhrA